jgi:hypothetical protein
VSFLKLETINNKNREEIRIGKQKRGAKLLKRKLDGNQEYSFFIKIPEKGKKLSTPRMLKNVS